MDMEIVDDEVAGSDWGSSIRLAALFSMVAATAAMIFTGHVPETTIILSIIVIGTAISWLHLEATPKPALVRYSRRHHR